MRKEKAKPWCLLECVRGADVMGPIKDKATKKVLLHPRLGKVSVTLHAVKEVCLACAADPRATPAVEVWVLAEPQLQLRRAALHGADDDKGRQARHHRLCFGGAEAVLVGVRENTCACIHLERAQIQLVRGL